MKDYEIILWLSHLVPESEAQAKSIKAMEMAFRDSTGNEYLDEGVADFIQLYDRETIINVPTGELYNEYFDFCVQFDYVPVSQNMLTRIVKKTFKVHVMIKRINDKSTRVFR